MGKLEQQVRVRAKGVTIFLKRGFKVVGDSCKKGWFKVRHARQTRR